MSAKANHLEQTCLQCRHLMVAVCRNVQNVPAEKYIFILQLCAFYACKKHYNTSVIGFDNNTWKTLFEGEFHAMHDATGYFDSFKIDGEQVTREQYNKTLSSYMNPENLSMNMRELTYDRLLSYEECRDELASGSITYYSGNVIDRSEVLIPSSYDEWIEQRE